jgi:hypothetical protein
MHVYKSAGNYNAEETFLRVCATWVIHTLGIVFDFRFSQGQAVAQWLRLYAASKKVAGSIPDEVICF